MTARDFPSPVPSERDRREVAELLGRAPNGAFQVVVRHRDGGPLVIANAPFLDDGTPMPTSYWLVGEPERTWVGQLESTGAVDRVEAELDVGVIEAMHRRYAAERDAKIPADHAGPRPFGGVGGTRVGVKCLHAHLAWHLAGGDDPVGRWVMARLADQGKVPDAQDATPVAAVDCGTNSTRLLISARGSNGGIDTLTREMQITRLGQGVDKTGSLAPEAIERTAAALRDYRVLMERAGVRRVRATATSAARDATNADAFFDAAYSALGHRPELISGLEEGALSFAGATASLDPAIGPFLVVDIGGGSTEMVAGSRSEAGVPSITGVESLSLGCVRLTERYQLHDRPTADALEGASIEARELVEGALDRISGARQARTLVGLAGTVSALASIDLTLDTYDRDRVHHHQVSAQAVEDITRRLSAMSVQERRAVPGVEAQRADVLVGGLIVARAVVNAMADMSMMVSESDILDGLVASLLD